MQSNNKCIYDSNYYDNLYKKNEIFINTVYDFIKKLEDMYFITDSEYNENIYKINELISAADNNLLQLKKINCGISNHKLYLIICRNQKKLQSWWTKLVTESECNTDMTINEIYKKILKYKLNNSIYEFVISIINADHINITFEFEDQHIVDLDSELKRLIQYIIKKKSDELIEFKKPSIVETMKKDILKRKIDYIKNQLLECIKNIVSKLYQSDESIENIKATLSEKLNSDTLIDSNVSHQGSDEIFESLEHDFSVLNQNFDELTQPATTQFIEQKQDISDVEISAMNEKLKLK